MSTEGLSPSLGFGSQGLLLAYGGTTDPLSDDPDQLLDGGMRRMWGAGMRDG